MQHTQEGLRVPLARTLKLNKLNIKYDLSELEEMTQHLVDHIVREICASPTSGCLFLLHPNSKDTFNKQASLLERTFSSRSGYCVMRSSPNLFIGIQ